MEVKSFVKHYAASRSYGLSFETMGMLVDEMVSFTMGGSMVIDLLQALQKLPDYFDWTRNCKVRLLGVDVTLQVDTTVVGTLDYVFIYDFASIPRVILPDQVLNYKDTLSESLKVRIAEPYQLADKVGVRSLRLPREKTFQKYHKLYGQFTTGALRSTTDTGVVYDIRGIKRNLGEPFISAMQRFEHELENPPPMEEIKEEKKEAPKKKKLEEKKVEKAKVEDKNVIQRPVFFCMQYNGLQVPFCKGFSFDVVFKVARKHLLGTYADVLPGGYYETKEKSNLKHHYVLSTGPMEQYLVPATFFYQKIKDNEVKATKLRGEGLIQHQY